MGRADYADAQGMVLIIGFLLLTSFAVSVAITTVLEYAGHWLPVPKVVAAGADT